MKNRMFTVLALMLTLMLAGTVVFASSRTAPAKTKIPTPSYEEVSIEDQVKASFTFLGNHREAARLTFKINGIGEKLGERDLLVSIDNYNIMDLEAHASETDYCHEITCGWKSYLAVYGDPIIHTDPETGADEVYYLWNHDNATVRVVIREDGDVLGYALIRCYDIIYDVDEETATYGMKYNSFFNCEVVKAVMFVKDGEPYRGVTMEEVNALLDETAISANKANDAELEIVKKQEDNSMFPEIDSESTAEPEGGDLSKITESDSKAESENDGEIDDGDETDLLSKRNN